MNREIILKMAKHAGFATEVHLTQGSQTEYVWGGPMEMRKLEEYTDSVVRQCIFEIVHGSLGKDYKTQDFCTNAVERIKETFGLKI